MKPKVDGNMFPRLGRPYRLILYLFLSIINVWIFDAIYRAHYHQHVYEFATTEIPVPPYNRYIDQNGNYLPSFGYKILQLATHPISYKFTELLAFLKDQPRLLEYFTLVLPNNYHVTLTDLVNSTAYDDKSLAVLAKEQTWLDKFETMAMSYGRTLSIIDRHEIRMEIVFIHNYAERTLKEYQRRWTETIPMFIAQHRTSFYVTLAYQYKDIPSKEVFDELESILKEWQQYSVDIALDPIEICSYRDLSNYTAVLPETNGAM